MLSSLRVTRSNTTRRRRKTPREISHRIRSPGTKTRRRLRRSQIAKRPSTPGMQRRKHLMMMPLPRRRSRGRRTWSPRRFSAGGRSLSGHDTSSNRHGKRQSAPARANDGFLRDAATWSRLAVLPNLMAEKIPSTTTVRILRLRQVFHRRWRSQRRRYLLC